MNDDPAATSMTCERALAWTAARRDRVVPSPSCPEALDPQHLTMLDEPVTAHVWDEPALRARAPETYFEVTGVERLVVFPVPSWPEVFLPQHLTSLEDPVIAQVW